MMDKRKYLFIYLQAGRRRDDRRRQTDDESSVLDSQDVSSADRGKLNLTYLLTYLLKYLLTGLDR